INKAIYISHEVLIRISPGYPSVQGRLHTRYAPVRRSLWSKLQIPLDLHVLGLPLAFILSQDQTLHRIIFNYNPLINSKSYLASSFCCQSNMYMYVVFFFNLYKAKTS